MKSYLFTYGSLADGKGPAEIRPVMKKLRYVGEGYVHGRLYDLGEYAGAKLSRSVSNRIYGRVFELPEDPMVLKRLDEYEEYFAHQRSDSLFLRKHVPVNLLSGEEIKSWIYVYNKPTSRSSMITDTGLERIAA
jgi:gamma-glutamylcyclotransferase (GGCT)/AIG2-like uncharacterized protein YtfP